MTAEEKWAALSRNDKSFDDMFFYAVKTTGIFCRPSCKSRLPLRQNVVFFDHASQALEAGFKPCKRCRPDLMEYQPAKETALKLRQLTEDHFPEREFLKEILAGLGLSLHRANAIFKERYGTTLKEYTHSLRLEETKTKLANTDEPVMDICFNAGFNSLSAFYAFFRKRTNTSPARYRDRHRQGKTGHDDHPSTHPN